MQYHKQDNKTLTYTAHEAHWRPTLNDSLSTALHSNCRCWSSE